MNDRLRYRHPLRCLWVALLLMLLPLLASAASAAEAGAFQRLLDRHGIDYQVPATGKAILVNIPAYELVAFEDGAPILRSRVIVGTPWTRTPLRETETSVVRFRPTWRPTPSMVASGECADYVRPPGEDNPLGLAAVRLEPGFLVYLHDTNRRDLFAQDDRALSHGCVRVQDWDRLIAWLLDMPLAEVHRHASTGGTHDVAVPGVPVSLNYLRRFPDAEGRILCHPDIYGKDPAGC
ncbi:L,D-transpeptidase catalytic domain [Roseivivax lentus]|uniref:L,D-transpeptidase catalytic domain n=1 Tax=Roseivivax lentus TaxID=633194 RepID=A0A1N7LPE6_9RHOB|nr:L,D-transpeptidase family protein [Roseivivax lentus]SIS75733.1 L,D-transpeptidase catalytic domain [Roseivivax lentus]